MGDELFMGIMGIALGGAIMYIWNLYHIPALVENLVRERDMDKKSQREREVYLMEMRKQIIDLLR